MTVTAHSNGGKVTHGNTCAACYRYGRALSRFQRWMSGEAEGLALQLQTEPARQRHLQIWPTGIHVYLGSFLIESFEFN